jgi:hypothetical protein
MCVYGWKEFKISKYIYFILIILLPVHVNTASAATNLLNIKVAGPSSTPVHVLMSESQQSEFFKKILLKSLS